MAGASRPAAPAAGVPDAQAPGAQRAPYRSSIQGRQTFIRSVRAEWVKLWSLRSTWIISVITVVLTAFFGAVLSVAYFSIDEARSYAADMVTGGIAFGQVAVCVQGALAVTGEYATGQIRSSLAATPRRGRLLWSKALVVSALAFLLGLVSLLATWIASAPFMDGEAGSLTDPEFLGYFWGAGLSFAGIALMCLGLGFLTRTTAGTITIAVGLLFVIDLPLSLAAQRWEWAERLSDLLPSSVSGAVSDPFSRAHTWGGASESPFQPDSSQFLDHWQAVAVFALWALVPVVSAWAVLSKRDA